MSLFDKDLLTTKSEAEQFADYVKEWVEINFEATYQHCNGITWRIGTSYNYDLKVFQKSFDKYGIYHPWIHIDKLERLDDMLNKYYLITLYYTNDEGNIYAHDKAKKLFDITLKRSIDYEFV